MKKPRRVKRVCRCGKVNYPKASEAANLEEPWKCPVCDDRQIFRDNARRPEISRRSP